MSPSRRQRADRKPCGTDRAVRRELSLPVRVTLIVENQCTVDSELMTGRQIKETVNIPASFTLHRRGQGGNEPIADDMQVAVRNGDHFFARARKDDAR